MDIAIIGAGNVGGALAASVTRAGHRVTLASRDMEDARVAAGRSGGSVASDAREAARKAQLVVLALPYEGALEVADDIADEVAGKTVIDVTNPLKPDYSGLATQGTSAAEELQRRLPGAKVVKALNTLFASHQAEPKSHLDAFIAGDDAEAKQGVVSLVDSMGFTPLDVGPLSAARYLEGMAYLNITLNAANGWDWTSAWKLER